MRELDGHDSGGQFLRTALVLSVLEGDPVRLENVRGDRSPSGLRQQHLAVLETMAAVCDADVSAADIGTETLELDPTPSSTTSALAGGHYSVDIDTAGSLTLLFGALLPLATRLEAPLAVTATGGTDVAWSPPLDYFRFVALPLLRRVGLQATLEVDRRGFYPDGGGRATLRLAPSNLESIDLDRRGGLEGVRIYSTEAASLADADVANRQAEGAFERLRVSERDVVERVETTAASDSPGSAVVLRLDHEGGIAGFSALGEPGKPAERVGEDAADAANRFLEGDAPVDRHLADQLLVFLALAGGRLRIPTVTAHVDSSLGLLEAFGAAVSIESDGESPVLEVS